MISNTDYLLIYHKTTENHKDIWTSYVYEKVWCFEKDNANMQKGYENTNKIEIRIPYDSNPSANIRHFDIGDIIVKFKPTLTVEQINELKVKEVDQLEIFNFANLSEVINDFNFTSENLESAYDIHYITTIANNVFGKQKHIHLGGK